MQTLSQVPLFEGRDVWRRAEIDQIMTALEMANDTYADAFEVLRRALGIKIGSGQVITLRRMGQNDR